MGHFLITDQNGFFINESSIEKIQSPWKDAVEEIKQVYINHLGDVLKSIYVRGSVSKGEAIGEVSDVDAFAVVEGGVDSLDLSWIPKEQLRLEQKYLFSTGFDLEVKAYDDILSGKKYFHELTITAMSACIYGEDLAPSLRKFKPSLEIAQKLHGDLAKRIEQARVGLNASTDEREIKAWCSYIMRRIVRSGCAILISRTGKYTRDLYPCYEIFSEYYPEKSRSMYEALELALNPTTDKGKITSLLDAFGVWMVEQVSQALLNEASPIK